MKGTLTLEGTVRSTGEGIWVGRYGLYMPKDCDERGRQCSDWIWWVQDFNSCVVQAATMHKTTWSRSILGAGLIYILPFLRISGEVHESGAAAAMWSLMLEHMEVFPLHYIWTWGHLWLGSPLADHARALFIIPSPCWEKFHRTLLTADNRAGGRNCWWHTIRTRMADLKSFPKKPISIHLDM